MSSPYIGEIRAVGFGWAPQGWALCNGAILKISDFSELFTLIGTTYGGDGATTFALPKLNGSVAIGQGTGSGGGSQYALGQAGGSESVTLTTLQLPQHNHMLQCQIGAGTSTSPTNNFFANPGLNVYAASDNDTNMGSTVSAAGGSQSHTNMQPFQVINFIIATSGIFPSQN